MKRLYWQDTYLMAHATKITAVGQDELGAYLRLDETIFHPQGGGQPADEGTINGVKVVKLKDLREINEINHYVEEIDTFQVGDAVQMVIDAEKRLLYAALHTAGHITGGVLRTANQYKDQLSANHFPGQARVEFKLAENIKKEVLVERVNTIIEEARLVCQSYDENGLRCIAIDNLWTEPCSGTHVSDTGQITAYEIRKLEAKKERLTVGYNALFQKRGLIVSH